MKIKRGEKEKKFSRNGEIIEFIVFFKITIKNKKKKKK